MMEGHFPDIFKEPPIEKWVPGDENEAEGLGEISSKRKQKQGGDKPKVWGRSKVFKDITEKTARRFPAPKQAQWHALKEFHESYLTSDKVPTLPLNVSSAHFPEYSFPMQHGTPYDWHAAWKKLAFRFPRPHEAEFKARMGHGASAADAQTASILAAQEQAGVTQTGTELTSLDVARLNHITGANVPLAVRKQVSAADKLAGRMMALGKVEQVLAGQWYFVRLPQDVIEGKLQVGLARALENGSSGRIYIKHTHIHTRPHTCTHAHTHAHMQTYTHTHTNTHTRPHLHTHTRTHRHAHTARTHANKHTRSHTRTHVKTQVMSRCNGLIVKVG